MLAERVQNISESPVLQMTKRSVSLKNQGIDVINMSIGEPDFSTPFPVKEKAKQAIDKNITHYPPVNGFLELRRAIAHKLKRDNNLDYSPDEIVVSNGAKQSLINVFLSVLNPGDEVIVPVPYWVSYPDMIRLVEGRLIPLKTRKENHFKITPEQLENAISPKTKIFLLNSPSNPAGTVYTHEELAAIAAVLEKHPEILIISDEIYEYIIYSGSHTSMASFHNLKNRTAIINGVSKAFAMTGWRIGYMAGPSELVNACIKMQGQITSGAGTISQMAALKALKMLPKKSGFIKEMIKTFQKRRDLTIGLLNRIKGFQTDYPDGAFYLFPDVSYYFGKTDGETVIKNSSDFCFYLLNKAHVALVPGDAFGEPACVRFSYALATEKIVEAVNRIRFALENLHE